MEKFSALLAICGGNPPVTGGFPSQMPSNVELSFDINLNKMLNKQSSWRWFNMPFIWLDITLIDVQTSRICWIQHQLEDMMLKMILHAV